MHSIPIIATGNKNMAVVDLQSKLLQNCIIFVTDEINSESVSDYQAELLYLASTITPNDTKENPIQIYINSPGGEIYSFLGLYDTIQYLIRKGYIVETINIGLAASAAALLLLSGSTGHRYNMPNATVMLHNPSSYTGGNITDMEIDLKEVQRLKETLNNIIKEHAGEDVLQKIDRDFWLDSNQALQYNIIDAIK